MCHQISPWRNVAEGLVGPLFVVASDPLSRHATDLAESFKDVAVEHLLSVSSVEAFDETVLHGATGLDEEPLDAVPPRPLLKLLADQFRAVVHAQSTRLATDLDELIQRTHDAFSGQVGISMRSASRAQSSMTLKVRKRRPDHSASLMKSADQISLGRAGITSGAFTRAGSRRLPRRFKFSFKAL